MMDVSKDPKYLGKHVILIDGKVFTAQTREDTSQILKDVRINPPKQTPEIATFTWVRYTRVNTSQS